MKGVKRRAICHDDCYFNAMLSLKGLALEFVGGRISHGELKDVVEHEFVGPAFFFKEARDYRFADDDPILFQGPVNKRQDTIERDLG